MRIYTAAVLAALICATVVNAHMRNWNVPSECNINGVACKDIPGLVVPTTEANDCLSHPDRMYAGHDPPINDTETEFYGFYDGARQMSPDEPFCPGHNYGAWIHFPYPNGKGRQALLTSEKGKLKVYPANCADASWNSSETFEFDMECPGNHISWGQVTRAEYIAFNLSFPCPTAAVSNVEPTVEEFQMRLTSSGGPGDYYKQMSWTLKVASSCPKKDKKCPTLKPIPEPDCEVLAPQCDSDVDTCQVDDKDVVCRKDSGFSCPEGSEKSDKDYMCMKKVGNWKLHFSADKIAPGKCRPVNPCTSHPKLREYSKLLAPEREAIHVMMEGPQKGYMSLAFATDSMMNNSDSVYAWYDPKTDLNYIYVLPLGHWTAPALFQKLERSEYLTYAGMLYDNQTETQYFCFGRQEEVFLSKNTTFPNGEVKDIPNVPKLDFNDLKLVWAVHDEVDGIVLHTPQNRGSITLRDLHAPPRVNTTEVKSSNSAVAMGASAFTIMAAAIACVLAMLC